MVIRAVIGNGETIIYDHLHPYGLRLERNYRYRGITATTTTTATTITTSNYYTSNPTSTLNVTTSILKHVLI